MKVIITGATGFIGRNLAEGLRADGIDIRATGRSREVGRALRDKGIDFHPADLLDVAQLTKAFAPADCVIHCAGKTADWGKAAEFYDVNVVGTRNVVRACEEHGIKKILFTSTPSLYFTGHDRFDISESEPLPANPLTHYARTKQIAEEELFALNGKGFQVIVFRPRAVYGPHDRTIVPRILRLAEKRRFPLIGGGEALTDITYVDNFVDLVRTTFTAPPDAWNRVYNVSNGDPIRIRDWIATVLEIFDRPFQPKNVHVGAAKLVAGFMEAAGRLPFGPKNPSLTRFSVGYMAKSMTLSIESARKHLNYSPMVGNQEGFKRYAIWYQTSRLE
jgi:nucleoside-diphosphate-sugar epimerase